MIAKKHTLIIYYDFTNTSSILLKASS